MAFDQSTRNRLARFVGDCRALLSEEFTRQMQAIYGLDPSNGDVADINSLTLTSTQHETARLLRETLDHYLAGLGKTDKKARQEVITRIIREQAFTVLNRLCAVRMAESRGLVIECIGKGYQSKAFQLYKQLARTSLGEMGDAYRVFLFSVFDEFAVDLPVLFDRFSPQGRLFPRETALLAVLNEINHADIDPLWAEDETIGWIYQYFNSVEERRQMRNESQAPRNSRELAVRNQFFTPRYVVEFLTDNTLGRIWHEMTQGQTTLKDSCRYLVRRPNEIFLAEFEEAPEQEEPAEDLSQEELLKQPVHIPHRPLKDPRDIKMLDPACGSMHFGLYAFDLFERIYDEAWDLEAERGADAFARPEGLKPLHDTYGSKDAFLRDVPRLIIERNIHGIDIDPRAVQIAGLSLWLRAQRSWQAQNVKAQNRPQIERSNIVCAEPMPGEADMLEEFLKGLRADRLESLIRRVLDVPEDRQVRATARMAEALCDLVRTVWKEMELAGEAGSLLKIEESLANAIAKGKKEWVEKAPLFRVMEFGLTEATQTNPKVKYYKTVPGEEEDFWNRAEAMVLAALEDYAQQAQDSEASRRRMFARDAAEGFAFIDLCRRRFDVAVMNPPFGLPTERTYAYLQHVSPIAYTDLYPAFIARVHDLIPCGMAGGISSRSFLMTPRLERLRTSVLLESTTVLLDLGLGVMDSAEVEACAYVYRGDVAGTLPLIAIDCYAKEDKHDALEEALSANTNGVVACDRGWFRALPGHRLFYRLSREVRSLLQSDLRFEPDIGTARGGGRTFDDMRFLRLTWEPPISEVGRGKRWVHFCKGGRYAPFATDIHLCINWCNDGAEISAKNIQVNGQTAQARQAHSYYYRPGGTYAQRSKAFGVKVLPACCIFSSKGPAIFSESSHSPEFIIGWLNSPLIRTLVEAQANKSQFDTGIVKRLPWVPNLSQEEEDEMATVSSSMIAARKRISLLDERDLRFEGLPEAFDFRDLLAKLTTLYCTVDESMASGLQKWNQFCERKYGVTADMVRQLLENGDESSSDIDGNDDEEQEAGDAAEVAARVVSVAFGKVIGRWGYMVASNGNADTSDPFAALSAAPPALLIAESSLCGIIQDDSDSPGALSRLIAAASAEILSRPSEDDIASTLGHVSLDEYLRRPTSFFADHLKMYSKSHRCAPIYWPISTPSGSFALWLYYHRLTDETLYTCVNDFVDPKLKQVFEEASRLRSKSNRPSAEEKELERLSDLELELKDFRDELLRIAKFWKPNLNDGVQITAAPLWKLFRHRQWQNRLKETWQKLEAGEYDWAHLALSIWPNRVVRASHKDRSYAIAHDLEDQLWHEVEVEKIGRGGRVTTTTEWQPRDLSESELNQIIAEVKAR